MMTAIQRSITTLFMGVALGALAVAALVWWWIGPRRKKEKGHDGR